MKVEDYKENYITGWIKSYRSKFNHWVASNKDYFFAWDWLLHHANRTDNKILLGSELVNVRRGQKLTSIRNFGMAVGMTDKQVRRFWMLLENDGMIVRNSGTKWTKLTICNYDVYQDVGQTKGKQRANNGQQTRNIEEVKNMFKETIKPYIDKEFSGRLFTIDDARSFLDYWSEPNQANTKLRYELERTWSITGRISRRMRPKK